MAENNENQKQSLANNPPRTIFQEPIAEPHIYLNSNDLVLCIPKKEDENKMLSGLGADIFDERMIEMVRSTRDELDINPDTKFQFNKLDALRNYYCAFFNNLYERSNLDLNKHSYKFFDDLKVQIKNSNLNLDVYQYIFRQILIATTSIVDNESFDARSIGRIIISLNHNLLFNEEIQRILNNAVQGSDVHNISYWICQEYMDVWDFEDVYKTDDLEIISKRYESYVKNVLRINMLDESILHNLWKTFFDINFDTKLQCIKEHIHVIDNSTIDESMLNVLIHLLLISSPLLIQTKTAFMQQSQNEQPNPVPLLITFAKWVLLNDGTNDLLLQYKEPKDESSMTQAIKLMENILINMSQNFAKFKSLNL